MNTTPNTPEISFRAKVEHLDGERWRVKFPRFTASHIRLDVLRKSPVWGSLANSSLLAGALDRAARKAIGCSRDAAYIYSDRLTPAVQVDTSKFLAVVTVDISGGWK
jgi:hypothetical protein